MKAQYVHVTAGDRWAVEFETCVPPDLRAHSICQDVAGFQSCPLVILKPSRIGPFQAFVVDSALKDVATVDDADIAVLAPPHN